MSALLFLSCCQTSNNATHLMKKRMNGMSAFEVLRRVPRGGLSERGCAALNLQLQRTRTRAGQTP